MPQPGDPAPGFRLAEARGGELALVDLHGRWVVLFFFPKSSTPG